jgi:hypothetical protein
MSPNIDFTNGAKLSFKINVFTMAGFFPGDTIRLYLFKKTGTAITRTLLADFAYMNSSNMNFRDTNNIIIPPTTGTETYLGFYYTTYNNWFNVAIDNINITPNIPAGIDDVNNPAAFTVFPNPAGNSINWDLEGKPTAKNTNVLLTDVTGKLLTTVPFATKTMDIGTLAPGIYYLKLGNRTARFIKQ